MAWRGEAQRMRECAWKLRGRTLFVNGIVATIMQCTWDEHAREFEFLLTPHWRGNAGPEHERAVARLHPKEMN